MKLPKLYIPSAIKTQMNLAPFCFRAETEIFFNFTNVSYFGGFNVWGRVYIVSVFSFSTWDI